MSSSELLQECYMLIVIFIILTSHNRLLKEVLNISAQ